MSSKRPAVHFGDIIANIDAIMRYTDGQDQQAFEDSPITIDATLTCLLRISEAAKRLGDDAHRLAPHLPWPAIRAIGNRLRHEYDSLAIDEIWNVVSTDLAPLRGASVDAIRQLTGDDTRDSQNDF